MWWRIGDEHAGRDQHSAANSNHQAVCHRASNQHANTYRNRHANGDGDVHADKHNRTNADTDANAETDADAHSHAFDNARAKGERHKGFHSHATTDGRATFRNPIAYAHTSSAAITNGHCSSRDTAASGRPALRRKPACESRL
jgi:hypothetical protein